MSRLHTVTLAAILLVLMTSSLAAAKMFAACRAATVMSMNAEKLLNITYTLAVTHNITSNKQFETLYNEANSLLQKVKTYLSENECLPALRYSIALMRVSRKTYVVTILLLRNATENVISRIVNVTMTFVDHWINRTMRIMEKHENVTIRKIIRKEKVHIWRELRRCMNECRVRCEGNMTCLVQCARVCELNAMKNITNITQPIIRNRVKMFIMNIVHRINKTLIMRLNRSRPAVMPVNITNNTRAAKKILRDIDFLINRLKIIEKRLARYENISEHLKKLIKERIDKIIERLRNIEKIIESHIERTTTHNRHVTTQKIPRARSSTPYARRPTRPNATRPAVPGTPRMRINKTLKITPQVPRIPRAVQGHR